MFAIERLGPLLVELVEDPAFQELLVRDADLRATRVIAASRGAAAPSRHRRASAPSDELVGGLWSKFEPIPTASGPW